MKKIVIILLALIFMTGAVSCGRKAVMDLTEMDYSENIESIASYFDGFDMIEKVYFKSTEIDNGSLLGPTNLRIVGFVCLSEEETSVLCENYDFDKKSPQFPDGISPEITRYTDFNWTSCKEYTNKLLKGNFVGEAYLDTNNGVVYLYVENA